MTYLISITIWIFNENLVHYLVQGRKHIGAEKARKILKPILALLLLFNIKHTSVFSIKPLFR